MFNNLYRLNILGLVLFVLVMGFLVVQPFEQVNAQEQESVGEEDFGRRPGRRGRFCSDTARLQLAACRNEVMDDFYTNVAKCIQVQENGERKECNSEASSTRKEENRFCGEQFYSRTELCEAIGEGRYDPNFDPSLFNTDFVNPMNPNPYYPLQIGNVWEYESEDESSKVEVLDRTKLIDGVTCLVVNDFVQGDESSEDTDDWFGLRKDGTVDYCGEEVKDFEIFPGDSPQLPELVSIDGSFKAGREGDLTGTIFPANPTAGATYRQEYSFGNAEDAATILSTTYGYGSDPELDEFAPQGLVDLMCEDSDCIVTREYTPIEPDGFELKYYANGIGLFLEVKPDSGEINQLVSCNFNAKCNSLRAKTTECKCRI